MISKRISMWHKALRMAISIVALGASVSADAGFLGIGGDSWKQEVLLHAGLFLLVLLGIHAPLATCYASHTKFRTGSGGSITAAALKPSFRSLAS